MLKWFVFLFLNITIVFWLIHFSVMQWMFGIDVTYLTSVILAVYSLSFVYIGFSLFSENGNLEYVWFASDQLLGLGMLGTVIGFMIMLSTNLTDVKIDDAKNVIVLLQTMTSSMGTALITTAVGLVCSMLLKTQLVIMEK